MKIGTDNGDLKRRHVESLSRNSAGLSVIFEHVVCGNSS